MNDESKKKPILLCILDGFGFGDEDSPSNAIARSDMPNYRRFLTRYNYSKLETSGLAVGLPEGQIGNSEVGHMTIGAGRVIFQDLVRINKAVQKDELSQNEDLLKLILDLQKSKKAVHLCGLFSDGGVHAHQDHIFYLAKTLARNNIKVNIHAFLDGRDVAQKSALKFYNDFLEQIGHLKNIKISSACGRYYAMDRDNKWDRVKLAYDVIVNAKSNQNKNGNIKCLKELIENSYKNDIFDEFIEPCFFGDYKGVQDGDALIFANFRSDRVRQISNALINPNFKEFATKKVEFSHKLSMTSYSDDLDKLYNVLFKSFEVKNGLAEILSKNNKSQLRIAETEKYAHVTFFFSGGQESQFKGEERILIDSPNVKTYDLKPEMSASKVSEKLIDAIESRKFDFIVVNYANPDMVGHSGSLDASIKACEVIDKQMLLLENAILNSGGSMLITADHGNIECMKDENGQPHTSHTTNLVPFILVSNKSVKGLSDGNLSDIAPTIIDLMGLEKPNEMTGANLIKK